MGQVVVLPEVNAKLDSLVDTLHDNGYFAFFESAVKYVADIADFITTIPEQQVYHTKNNRYGKFYCQFKPNKHTSWYITFDNDGDRYIVRNIINNHTSEYPTYIK